MIDAAPSINTTSMNVLWHLRYARPFDIAAAQSSHPRPDLQVNYAKFREHEIKAFWEYLQATGTKVVPYGIAGPLPGSTMAVDLDIKTGEHPW